MFFCLRATYMVRQNNTGVAGLPDFTIEKLDSDVGCLSHFNIWEIHNKVWFWSEDGPWLYDGSFRFLGKEIVPLVRDDFEENRQAFTEGWAMHDRINKCYQFVTNRRDREEFENTGLEAGTVTYVGYYGAFEPSMSGTGEHPDWSIDLKDRFDSCGFYNENGELVIGSCDGVLRKQDWSNGDDDGDALEKEMIIRRGHDLYFEPGDDDEDGKFLAQLWAYVVAESATWSIYVRGGDEEVWDGLLPENDFLPWKAEIQPSAKSELRQLRGIRSGNKTGLITYAKKTVHYFKPDGVTGRGFTIELRATSPRGLEYRGVGGLWGPGAAQRGPTEFQQATFDLDVVAAGPGIPVDPTVGDVVVSAPGAYSFTVSEDFFVGVPTYPILVTLVATATGGAAVDYTDTDSIVDPDPAPQPGSVSMGNVTLADGDSYSLLFTAVDAAGEVSNRKIGSISCVVP